MADREDRSQAALGGRSKTRAGAGRMVAGMLIRAALAAVTLTAAGAVRTELRAAALDVAAESPGVSAPICFCVAPCVNVTGCVRANTLPYYYLPGNTSSGYFCNTFGKDATAQPADWPLTLQNKNLSVNVDFRAAPNCDGTGTVKVRLGPKPACPSAASGLEACNQCGAIAKQIGDIGPDRGQCYYGASSYSCTSCVSELWDSFSGRFVSPYTGASVPTSAPSASAPSAPSAPSAAQSIAASVLATVVALAAATLR